MRPKPIDTKYSERLLYPIVPIVVTAEYKGRVGGMFAAWWSQLSFKPFMMGVGIAPERYTYKLIKYSEKFGVNFLDFRYVEETPYIGDVSERFLRDKIRKGGFEVFRGQELGVPLLIQASGAMELKVVDVVETGDHDLFIGEVVSAYATDDFTDGMWDLSRYRPLMYLGRMRRGNNVYRVYVTGESYVKREVNTKLPELETYIALRNRAIREIMDKLESLGEVSVEDALKELSPIADKYELDEGDLLSYLEEARRRGKVVIAHTPH